MLIIIVFVVLSTFEYLEIMMMLENMNMICGVWMNCVTVRGGWEFCRLWLDCKWLGFLVWVIKLGHDALRAYRYKLWDMVPVLWSYRLGVNMGYGSCSLWVMDSMLTWHTIPALWDTVLIPWDTVPICLAYAYIYCYVMKCIVCLIYCSFAKLIICMI
jgi:hypothetical protein